MNGGQIAAVIGAGPKGLGRHPAAGSVCGYFGAEELQANCFRKLRDILVFGGENQQAIADVTGVAVERCRVRQDNRLPFHSPLRHGAVGIAEPAPDLRSTPHRVAPVAAQDDQRPLLQQVLLPIGILPVLSQQTHCGVGIEGDIILRIADQLEIVLQALGDVGDGDGLGVVGVDAGVAAVRLGVVEVGHKAALQRVAGVKGPLACREGLVLFGDYGHGVPALRQGFAGELKAGDRGGVLQGEGDGIPFPGHGVGGGVH